MDIGKKFTIEQCHTINIQHGKIGKTGLTDGQSELQSSFATKNMVLSSKQIYFNGNIK